MKLCQDNRTATYVCCCMCMCVGMVCMCVRIKCMYVRMVCMCVRMVYICVRMVCTVGDKIKFPLCTDSPPTCERSCQQKSPKSRPKVASDFRRTLNVIKIVADLFLSGEKIVCARIQFKPKSRACANGTRRSCNFAY